MRFTVLAFSVMLAACDPSQNAVDEVGSATGTLSSHGGALGDFTFAPTSSVGSDPLDEGALLFVDLIGGARRVRAAIDPVEGPLVVFLAPDSTKRLIVDGNSTCRTFRLEMYDSDGAPVSENDDVDHGGLTIDCDPVGGTVMGTLAFSSVAHPDGSD